jgi:hypothetical protein
MRLFLISAILLPAALSAQAVKLSGNVRGDLQSPVEGATARLTGGETRTTRGDGRFQFDRLTPGRYILTVTAIGYQPYSIALELGRDTTVAIALSRSTVVLDTMRIRPGALRIRGEAVDQKTGESVLHVDAILYPGGKIVGARSGSFRFDSLSPGPTMVVVEGLEHVPAAVRFDLRRDTTIRIAMPTDSVAIRMMAVGAKRLASRSNASPVPMKALGRDDIPRMGNVVGEIVSRMLFEDPMEVRKAYLPAEDGCFFLDDVKVSRAMYDALDPSEVERIEVFRRVGGDPPSINAPKRQFRARNFSGARMVRVYTKRFAVTVPARDLLPRIVYMQAGLGTVCH